MKNSLHVFCSAIFVALVLNSGVLTPFQAKAASFQSAATTLEDGQNHLQDWEFAKGDWILANVKENTLQFVRNDDSERSVKVKIGSGLNNGKKISYLGMSYNPATPERTWEIRSKQQQNTHWIFGSKEAKEQLFLRLYEVKGEERIFTNYGIHTTPAIDNIIDKHAGFGSWGCLITRYDLLKQIEQLFELNEGVVKVITTRG